MDGRDVPALSLEDELVLICVHGAKHFWERLMWTADIAAMVVFLASAGGRNITGQSFNVDGGLIPD